DMTTSAPDMATRAPDLSADMLVPPIGPTFYVNSGTGNDGNAGTSVAPWKTLVASIPRLHPGDTLIMTGRFSERPGFSGSGILFDVSGTATSPITFKGQNCTLDVHGGSGDYANYVFSGSYLIFDGFDITASAPVYYGGAL